MAELKKHLSFDEQLKLLEERNLILKNKEKMKLYLENYNYQNIINGYNDPFLKFHSRFLNLYDYCSSDKSIISLFEFDRKISLLSWEYITDFERILSTKISYFITEKMNALGFKNGNIFALNDKHWNAIFKNKKTKNEIKLEICKFQKKQDINLLKKYKNDNEKPIWSMILLSSFGTLSILFDVLTDDIRYKIINSFSNIKINVSEFSVLISLFVKIRNRIAHNNPLYNLSILKNRKKQFNKFISNNNLNFKISNSGIKFYDFVKILSFILNSSFEKRFLKIYKKYIKNNKNISKIPKKFINNKLNIN